MSTPGPWSPENGLSSARRETERRIELIRERCRSRLGEPLLGILLVGSVAEARESYALEGEELRLLSDLDLYCVLDSAAGPSKGTLREIHEAVTGDPFLHSGLDLSIVDEAALQGMDDALKAGQARERHRWLWRREGWEAPPIRAAGDRNPGPIDSFRLVCNRAAEELLQTQDDGRPAGTLRAAYTRWKLIRDLPLALHAASSGAEEMRGRIEDPISARLRRSLNWPRLHRLLDTVEALNAEFAAGPVTKKRLDSLSRIDLSAEERRRSHREILESVWPLYRYIARRVCEPESKLEATIDRAESHGPSCDEGDAELFRSLPRRGGAVATLRRAYLYRHEAPPATRSWWRYGLDGAGPERVQAAAALAFAGARDPGRLLRDLYLHPETGREDSSGKPCDALWVGRLWRDWILGEG